MSRFKTYHWRGVKLDDPTLEDARLELESGTDVGRVESAFVQLIQSGNMTAIGMALDHYHYAVARERHGFGSALKKYATQVLECARSALLQSNVSNSEVGDDLVGAKYASALLIMINRAKPEDSPLLVSALNNVSQNSPAESAAFQAAGRALRYSSSPDQKLINAIANVVFDDSRDIAVRLEALQGLSKGSASEVLQVLARVAQLDDLELQVAAIYALALSDFASYRGLIERKAAAWSENLPYPASDVKEILHVNNPQGE